MRISDWSSDVCSSDLLCRCRINLHALDKHRLRIETFVRHVQRDNIAGLDPDPLRPGGEADRPRFPAVDNVVSGKLASLNTTRFAGEALPQLIGDFLGPPSAVRDRKSTRLNSSPSSATRMPAAPVIHTYTHTLAPSDTLLIVA